VQGVHLGGVADCQCLLDEEDDDVGLAHGCSRWAVVAPKA
jgi:hypothetical protein